MSLYSLSLLEQLPVYEGYSSNVGSPRLVFVNVPYSNRIQLILNSTISGPLVSPVTGPLGPNAFEVYVDGDLTPIQAITYDPNLNRYLIFTKVVFSPATQVIQLIYHMPQSPFKDTQGRVMSGFALIASVLQSGDTAMPQVSLAVRPPLLAAAPVALFWNATSVPQITVTSNSGYNSGLISAAKAAGVLYAAPFLAAGPYTATITGYDALGNVIIVGGNPLTKTINFTLM